MSLRIVVLALALASSVPALAAQASSSPMAGVTDVGAAPRAGGHGAMKACKSDRQKYCAGVEKGGGRVMACMKQHAADLSPGCKSAIQARRAERKAAK